MYSAMLSGWGEGGFNPNPELTPRLAGRRDTLLPGLKFILRNKVRLLPRVMPL